MLLVVLAATFTACKKRDHAHPDPGETFQSVKSTFLHGHLSSAQQEAEKAYQYFSAGNPEWAWKFRLLKAEILINRGLSTEALPLLEGQLPPNLTGGELPIKKFLLQGLAYTALDRQQEADESLQRAEQLCSSSPTKLTAEVLAGRGILEVRRDNLVSAEPLFRKALQLAHSQDDKFIEAAALLNLSFLTLHQQHYRESVDWSNSAYKLANLIDAGITEEKAQGNLGWSYYKMGDFERSRDLFEKASKGASDLGIVKDQARWLYNLGVVYFEQNQLLQAENNFQRALELATKTENTELKKDALSSLAFVSVGQGKLDVGERYSQQAFDLAHSSGDRVMELYASFTRGQIKARRQESDQAESIFLEIAKDRKSEASLRWQAHNELAGLYEQENRVEAAGKQHRDAVVTVECARDAFHHDEFKLSFLANAVRVYDDYIHFLVERGATGEALQLADYSRAQTLVEGLGLLSRQRNCASLPKTAIDVQQVARKARSTVLFYWLGGRQSYLWVVTSGRMVLIKLPEAAEIETLAQRYRNALVAAPDVLQTGNPDGIKLYDTLVAPAKKFIPSDSRVVVIADKGLNNLNFETLLVSAPVLHYWIEDVTLTNVSSLRILAASSQTPARLNGKLLLVGDPIVPDPEFPPLPQAAVEMKSIEKNFALETTRVYARSEATPQAFLSSKPEEFSYVHFVAHGTASQLSPLDSAVVLSKSTAEEDSYKLYARDIIGRRLRANLVTISACYGSGTARYAGEGLVGLSWAFVRAGAHNVIGALWAVSDTSTSQLMDQLYKELKQGRSPQAALRAAKLTLLHSNGIFRKPYYWAPFQIYTGS